DTPAPQEQPTDALTPPDTPNPYTTPATTEPAPEEKERLILNPSESPRSPEHKAVLVAREALKSDDPEGAMKYLVERNNISPEAAATLLEWGKNNKPGDIEEVGNSRGANGERITRYRMKTTNGTEDMLIDVVTDRNEIVIIAAAKASASDKTDISAACDHLTVAEGFIESVRRGDMMKANSMITGTQVSPATVAGLCLLFEEGSFSLREEAPIRNTFYNDTFAGYLVYLISGKAPKPANIGLELALTEPGWRVQAVSLDALLSIYEEAANEEGGRYFPIVKNPKGGDSLALFFGFNESDLTPRSLRQLQIVAELLKQTHGKLNISGHTDDVGSEAYNQALSVRRADAVKAALVGFGVAPEQITTHGLGKSQPRRTYKEDDSAQDIDTIRGENRRAEIYLDFES
ncbi:MAG: OmpA family protein, partial [Akkermansia sp.]|nr:OmpA family protein [Akkermansia sp.]